MKRNIIILVVAILIVFGLFALFGNKGPVADDKGTLQGQYTLQNIIDKKEPYECTFVKNDGSSTINGAVKVSDGNVRADFDITLQGQDGGTFASHFIMKDGTNYVWTSIQPVGYKAPIVASASKNDPMAQAQIIGLKDKIDYTCTPWNANLTVFNTPAGVTFLDIPKP